MKKIYIYEYNMHMGKLIDLSSPIDFNTSHHPDAVNIPYQRFMLHYPEFLNKQDVYYLTCKKGLNSHKAVSMLEYFGYNVVQVTQ